MLKVKVLPANCGDCIIISFNDGDIIKNILIDGGVGLTYSNVLKDEVMKIKELNQSIDLLIVTHIDNDHIGGIIKLIEDKSLNTIIKEVWFNSWTNFGKSPYSLSSLSKEIAPKQVKTLENELQDMNIWDNKLIRQGMFRKYEKAKLTVLSPNKNNLNNLNNYIKDEFKITEADDRDKKIETLQKRIFIEDTSIPNGSSIAFLFEYESKETSKKILFTGDAFPSVILEGLTNTKLIDENKNLELDYLKLSHHGSKFNTSDALLKKINCNNYIVTTQGCKGKPNKETFSRILKYHKPINLFFNYKNKKTENIFHENELNDIKINYLPENKIPYLIKVI